MEEREDQFDYHGLMLSPLPTDGDGGGSRQPFLKDCDDWRVCVKIGD